MTLTLIEPRVRRPTAKRSWRIPIAVLMVVSIGVGLRGARIDDTSLWVDEAESSINGLTILEHGLPLDRYLDLPIYENVLLRPWPESDEYEFKDLSYSDRGVAVYHGWLPLYAIALSQWLFGIEPDLVDERLAVRHDDAEMRRRTWVPRIPSIVFSCVFLGMMYLTARAIAGDAAGWAALVFSALNERLIWFGSQARYYAATLAFDAVGAWTLWRCIVNGRWRDFLIFAASLVLLFFTHSLSCMALIATALCMLPFMWRHDRFIAKVGSSVLLFAAGTLPWVWLSGLASHADLLPKARELVTWPDDVIYFLSRRPESVLFLVASAAYVIVQFLYSRRADLEAETRARLRRASCGAVLMGLWLSIAYSSFFLLMPAASFFWMRMTMTLEVPGILLVAIGVGTMTQRLPTHVASGVAAAVVLAFLMLSGRFVHPPAGPPDALAEVRPVVDHLRRASLSADTRLYAVPNSHLVWTYYTGMPVQSIAPIRSEFLNTYAGPIVFIDRFGLDWLTSDKLNAIAVEQGVDDELNWPTEWSEQLQAHLYAETIESGVKSVDGNEPLPSFLQPVLNRMRQIRDAPRSSSRLVVECPLVMKSFRVTTHQDSWQTFFYRFVDPRSRSGQGANFADRFKQARVTILSEQTAVFHVPPLNP
jgi:hypothetical protein